jgi:hypothetical protein
MFEAEAAWLEGLLRQWTPEQHADFPGNHAALD